MIIKICTFLVLFIAGPFFKPSDTDWMEKVIRSPDTYFSDAYEAHVFQDFISKFQPLKVTDSHSTESSIIYIFNSARGLHDYRLEFKTDDNKIRKVFRDLQENREEKSITDHLIIDWVGKFIYHLDTGNSESMYDLVYHNDTQLKYGELTEKRKIISKLLSDFPVLMNPDEITINTRETDYTVEIYIHLQEELILRVNSRLANITDTDELQETLFSRIKSTVKGKSQVKRDTGENNLLKLEKSYSYKQNRDTLIIDYPSFGMKAINKMKYILEKGTGKDLHTMFLKSLIRVNPDFKNGVVRLNDSYNLSAYADPLLNDPDIILAEKAIQMLFNQFVSYPQFPQSKPLISVSGKLNYRGYPRYALDIKNTEEWYLLLNEISKEGAIYFLPSTMEFNIKDLSVTGLIYIIKDNRMNFYHFGEIVANFKKDLSVMSFDLYFYPFLSRVGIQNFKK